MHGTILKSIVACVGLTLLILQVSDFKSFDTERCLYRDLQCSPSASNEEVRRSFRKLAKIYHPDKFLGKHDAEKAEAMREKYLLIQNAYARLKDKSLRTQYDAQNTHKMDYFTETFPLYSTSPGSLNMLQNILYSTVLLLSIHAAKCLCQQLISRI